MPYIFFFAAFPARLCARVGRGDSLADPAARRGSEPRDKPEEMGLGAWNGGQGAVVLVNDALAALPQQALLAEIDGAPAEETLLKTPAT